MTPLTQDLERIFTRLRKAVSEDSPHLLKPRVEQLEQASKELKEQVETWEKTALSLTGGEVKDPESLEARVRKRITNLVLDLEAAVTRENHLVNRTELLAREIQTWETVFHVFEDESNVIDASQGQTKLVQLRNALEKAQGDYQEALKDCRHLTEVICARWSVPRQSP